MDPYLPPNKRKVRKTRLLLPLFILVVVGGGLVYWLFFSSFWQVQAIEIKGLKKLTEEQIKDGLKEKFVSNNFLLWPKGALVVSNFPLVAKLQIKKSLIDRKISINVQEREALGVWCSGSDVEQQCWWFDNRSLLFEKAPKPEGSLIILIEEKGEKVNIQLGKRGLSDKFWANMKTIISSSIVRDFSVYKFVIDRRKEEVIAETAGGFKVYLSLRFDAIINIKALDKLIAQDDFDLEKISYFDLRVKNRLYYK
jgi:hypothetical protein